MSTPIMFFRCILDETVEFYTSHQPMVRFGLQAFQFIGMHEQVRTNWLNHDESSLAVNIMLLLTNQNRVFQTAMTSSLSVSLGVHQLFGDSVRGQQSQHPLLSGLCQQHNRFTVPPPSQKRRSHPDRQSLSLPGTPAAEEERRGAWR